MIKHPVRIGLKLAVSAGLLTYLLLTVHIDRLIPVFREMNLAWFAISFAILLVSVLIAAVRWSVLLRSRDTRLPVWRSLQLNLIGSFFNTFLPSTVGGDAVRAYQLSQLKGHRADSFVSVVIDRAIGLLALALMGTAAAIFAHRLVRGTGAVTALAIIWAVLAAGILLAYRWEQCFRLFERLVRPAPGGRIARLLQKAQALHESVAGFRTSHRHLAAALALSLLYCAINALSAWPLARALGADINPVYFFVFGPIRQCIMMIPISINGIGLREASAVFFYTQAGMTEAQALAYGLAGYAQMLLLSLIGGIVYACSGAAARAESPKIPPAGDAR